MKKVFLAFFVSILPSLYSGDFYGIIFADTEAQNISYHVVTDYQRMKSEMASLANSIDFAFKPIVLKGEDLSETKILETFKELKFGSDDIVFFYFTGHGQRPDEFLNDPWPMMTFNLQGGSSLDFTELTMKLLEMEPKLVIALADCCNFELSETPPIKIHFPKQGMNQGDKERKQAKDLDFTPFGRLLLDSTGLIMMSGASPGEPAWSCPSGSYYTMHFLQSISEEKKESQPGFEELLERVSNNLTELDQHPQYLIIPSFLEARSTLQTMKDE